MLLQVTIRHTALLAASTIAQKSRDESHVMRNVSIECLGTHGVVVAIDGSSTIMVHTIEAVYGDTGMDWLKVTVPIEVIKAAVETGKSMSSSILTLDDGKWSLNDISFIPVNDQYPEWRRPFAGHIAGLEPSVAYLDPTLVAKIAKVNTILNGSRAKPTPVTTYGNMAAIAEVNDRCFVGLMPARFPESNPIPRLRAMIDV